MSWSAGLNHLRGLAQPARSFACSWARFDTHLQCMLRRVACDPSAWGFRRIQCIQAQHNTPASMKWLSLHAGDAVLS